MSDLLRIKGLKAETVIGVSEEERRSAQAVFIDAEISLDLKPAGESDDLRHTVDYGALIGDIEFLAADGERRLLETLAEEIAQLVLRHEVVTAVTVEVAKAHVPVPQEVSSVSVRVIRAK